MTRVFDSSAVLAVIFNEHGSSNVLSLWATGDNLISAVNLCEVVSKLANVGMPQSEIQIVLESIPLTVVALNTSDAVESGLLLASTKPFGLSLGDRVCLNLGQQHNATIVTADRVWSQIDGFEISLIR